MSTIRLRAQLKEGIVEVNALIKHPMETGAQKDLETGQLIPAHFIEEVICEHEGQEVVSARWGVGISKNPYCSFKFEGGKIGEKVKLSWKDNQGQTDSFEVEIQPALERE